ncbi:MAG: hypothetical protein IPM54_37120 [Polyangiaceae bacterium]|nr:hypothetical protein [Polyangiaceae bacterium]
MSGSFELWVADIVQSEKATMLRDTTVDFVDFDEYGNVLEVDVSTVGVDLTNHLTLNVLRSPSQADANLGGTLDSRNVHNILHIVSDFV